MTMCQVATVGKIHAENYVVLLEGGHIDSYIGGCAGMGLHVGVFRSKEFLGAIDGQLLDFVGVFAAAIVALAWITFGVLIREDGPHGFEDGFGNEGFRGDEFEPGGLAPGFVAEEVCDLWVSGIERAIHAVVGGGGFGHEMSSSRRALLQAKSGCEAILSNGVEESQYRDPHFVFYDVAPLEGSGHSVFD
jgi:hypothetical protein